MKTAHPIWVVQAGPSGDVHHPGGQFETAPGQMAEELRQLVYGLSDVLERVQEASPRFRLDEVVFEATIDSQVGFALVGRDGAPGTVRLAFKRADQGPQVPLA